MSVTRRKTYPGRRKKVYRKFTKRFIRRPYKSRMYRSLGIPKARFTKLKWSAHYQFNLGAGTGATADFKINSCYDPVAAIGGTQPYYFDQYSAMYQRYRVYGVKINIIAAAQCATAGTIWPSMLLSHYCDSAPAWGTIDVAATAKGNVLRMIPLGQNKVFISKYYDLSKVTGMSKKEYNLSDTTQAYCVADPAKVIRSTVWIQNNDIAVAISPQYWIFITFYVKFFDPVEPAGS